jgi:hypothetical protein
MPLTPSPNAEAWTEFCDTVCHVCGGAKQKKTAFCRSCYFSLSRETQKTLWKRFGHGFESAYHAAKEWLIEERKART